MAQALHECCLRYVATNLLFSLQVYSLVKQIIYAYAKEIADKEPGYAGEAYREALADVRLPYWGWASNPHLPPATMSQDIVLTIPGDAVGKTKQKRLDHNPLYSYKFTSDYATDQMRSIMKQWPHTDKWRESKRCPDVDGNSHPEIADKQVGQFTEFKTKTFRAITSVKDFDQFTCQAWRAKQKPECYASVEEMHNIVHDYTGTIDVKSKKFIRGNTTEVQASSFDPIFWLHHVNCDRLVALWQALNPDAFIASFPSLSDRANAPEGTPEKMKVHVTQQIYKLYSTPALGGIPSNKPLKKVRPPTKGHDLPVGATPPDDIRGPDRPVNSAPLEGHIPHAVPPGGIAALGRTPKSWQAFLRVRNFALTGTWAVHFFFGELPADSGEWLLSPSRVGTVTMLSSTAREGYPNCVRQAADGIYVTGAVPLNESLATRTPSSKYLKDNLSWRAVKDTLDVPITEEFGLTVGVSSQDLTIPQSNSELPTWGPSHVFTAATAGKVGGLDENNRDELHL